MAMGSGSTAKENPFQKVNNDVQLELIKCKVQLEIIHIANSAYVPNDIRRGIMAELEEFAVEMIQMLEEEAKAEKEKEGK